MASKSRIFVDNVRSVLAARYHFRSAETIGPRVRLYGSPSVKNEGRLRIGNRVRFYSTIATLETCPSSGW